MLSPTGEDLGIKTVQQKPNLASSVAELLTIPAEERLGFEVPIDLDRPNAFADTLDDLPERHEGSKRVSPCSPGLLRFSLVIPAFNEADYLPRLLDTVDDARRRYHAGAESVEVIVADNASTDATAALARERGCRVARVEKRAIAAARNGGAAIARAPRLAFVDADFRIHPETFNALDRALDRGEVVGGATGATLDRWSPGIALSYLMLVPLVFLTGMDTGVVFCRRDDFEAVGGYDESRLYAEDVKFLWALRRLGRRRGQRLFRATEAKAVASTRKFDQFGDWHYFTSMPGLALATLVHPRAVSAFAKRYWYDGER